VVGVHDVRLVRGYSHTNVVFDVVLAAGGPTGREAVAAAFRQELAALSDTYRAVIHFDMDYSR
jgi:hypothetical protein